MEARVPLRVARSRLVGARSPLVVAAVCACAGQVACGYQPGSFRGRAAEHDFAGERATVGCLDLAVAGRWGGNGPVEQAVEIDFANRCARPVVVDFGALRAVGRDDSGREHRLAIRDPRHEIRPLSLEARTVGREVLELEIEGEAVIGRPARLRSACLDVGRLAGGARAAARWLCVARPVGPRAGLAVASNEEAP